MESIAHRLTSIGDGLKDVRFYVCDDLAADDRQQRIYQLIEYSGAVISELEMQLGGAPSVAAEITAAATDESTLVLFATLSCRKARRLIDTWTESREATLVIDGLRILRAYLQQLQSSLPPPAMNSASPR